MPPRRATKLPTLTPEETAARDEQIAVWTREREAKEAQRQERITSEVARMEARLAALQREIRGLELPALIQEARERIYELREEEEEE